MLPCEQARIGKSARPVRFADSVAYVDGLSKRLSASVGSASATCTVVVRIASADSAQNMHARLTLRTCNAAKFSRGSSQSRKSSRMPVCVFSKGRTKQDILRPKIRPNSSAAGGVPHETGVQSILIISSAVVIESPPHPTTIEECGEGREERDDGRRGTFKKAFDGLCEPTCFSAQG